MRRWTKVHEDNDLIMRNSRKHSEREGYAAPNRFCGLDEIDRSAVLSQHGHIALG